MIPPIFQTLAVLVLGIALGAVAQALIAPGTEVVHAQQATQPADVAKLVAELETIKGKLPDQAHAMQDVGYHFSNLWFAGQRGHWDLANFYWLETRSHLRWAIRIIPLRKDNAGNDVDVKTILEAFENGPLQLLQEAIADNDKPAFDKIYRSTLEGCYSCHKTSDKPFIRLQIPTQPETPIINFDPNADWPR